MHQPNVGLYTNTMDNMPHIQRLVRSKRIGLAIIMIFVCQILPVSLASADSSQHPGIDQATAISSHCMEMASTKMHVPEDVHVTSHLNQMEDPCCEKCSCFLGSCSIVLLGSVYDDLIPVSELVSSSVVSFYIAISPIKPLRPPTTA
jgi:hypothetical protein